VHPVGFVTGASFLLFLELTLGPYSSVRIATRYGLDDPGSNPFKARFSAHIQTGPWNHPPSYTISTVYFPEVKRPGRRVDHPPPSSAEVKDRVELYFYSRSGDSRRVVG